MAYLPGHPSIVEDVVIVCALAQARFVSVDNYNTLPYVLHHLTDQGDRLLLERLLALSIKVRFLDDKTGILKGKDRRLLTIGHYCEEGEPLDDEVCIRLALNKIVHHEQIAVARQGKRSIVFPAAVTDDTSSRKIPQGVYNEERVIVTVDGEYRGKSWQFSIDLFALLNELALVFE